MIAWWSHSKLPAESAPNCRYCLPCSPARWHGADENMFEGVKSRQQEASKSEQYGHQLHFCGNAGSAAADTAWPWRPSGPVPCRAALQIGPNDLIQAARGAPSWRVHICKPLLHFVTYVLPALPCLSALHSGTAGLLHMLGMAVI